MRKHSRERPPLRVAIAHDYLTQRGGAERVVLSMLRAFPGAPVYTALYAPDSTFSDFADHDVRPLWTNRIALLRRNHRLGLIAYPLAFGLTKLDFDVVLCSSSGFAHSIRASGHKIVYCYTPARWLYSESEAYISAWPLPVRKGLIAASPALRWWDRRSMRTASRVLTTSNAVVARIQAAYGSEAIRLPAPAGLETGQLDPVPGLLPGFVLNVGRLLSYKNVDTVLGAAMLRPQKQFVVAGDGPERENLLKSAPPNVKFIRSPTDDQLRWLYYSCSMIVSAAFEDYGLTPIEAAAFGKPVAALKRGGFLDTVVEGTTGLFFGEPHVDQVTAAIDAVAQRRWDPAAIQLHASEFSEGAFIENLRSAVWSTVGGGGRARR